MEDEMRKLLGHGGRKLFNVVAHDDVRQREVGRGTMGEMADDHSV